MNADTKKEALELAQKRVKGPYRLGPGFGWGYKSYDENRGNWWKHENGNYNRAARKVSTTKATIAVLAYLDEETIEELENLKGYPHRIKDQVRREVRAAQNRSSTRDKMNAALGRLESKLD